MKWQKGYKAKLTMLQQMLVKLWLPFLYRIARCSKVLPNKVVTFPESLIWYFPDILEILKSASMKIDDLQKLVASKIDDINLFILSLDALYALGQIDYIEESEMIKYVTSD